MAPEPVPGFKSLETHHCVTGSMRHIYALHHSPLSEDMLFGLGAGIGFIYWQMKGQPPIFGGRANVRRPGENGLEVDTGLRTGVQVGVFTTGSHKKAQQELIRLLEAGEPVMLQVDMGFLPYFEFPADFHFGGHVVVACGLDSEAGMVLIADRDAPLHEVSLAVLAQARGSTFKPFPPHHMWYTFDFGGYHAPEPPDVLDAIRQAIGPMLEPPIANIGVKGFRTAAQRIAGWPRQMTPDELSRACFNIFIFIDATGGTGGGMFRTMYGRFLAEAAEITGRPALREIAEQFRAIGDSWQEVAALMKAASQRADAEMLLGEAGARIDSIADCEQDAWGALRAAVSG